MKMEKRERQSILRDFQDSRDIRKTCAVREGVTVEAGTEVSITLFNRSTLRQQKPKNGQNT